MRKVLSHHEDRLGASPIHSTHDLSIIERTMDLRILMGAIYLSLIEIVKDEKE